MGRARRQHGPVEGEQLGPGFRLPGSRHPNWEAASDGPGPGPRDSASIQSTFEKGACAWRAPPAHHPARLQSGLGEAEQRAEKLDTPTLPTTCPRGAWACKTASLPQVTALALLQSTAPSPFPGLWGLQSPQAPLLASRSGRSSPESGPPLLQRRDLAVSHQP